MSLKQSYLEVTTMGAPDPHQDIKSTQFRGRLLTSRESGASSFMDAWSKWIYEQTGSGIDTGGKKAQNKRVIGSGCYSSLVYRQSFEMTTV
jgi:hypothetical protein